jgi:hypothetical protein
LNALAYALKVGVDILDTMLGTNPDPTTGVATGTILAQTGNVTKGITDCDAAEMWQHVGFASRPSNPLAGKAACQGIALVGTDRDFVICTRDTRTNQIYGNLAPGETCLFAAGADGNAQARLILKADGSITGYTTDDNTPTGKAIYLRIHPEDGLTFVSPWGTIAFDQVGFRATHQSGFSLVAGSIGGLPGPFAALNSYLTMSAATITANGAQVYLGGGPVYLVAAGGLGSNPLSAPGIPIAPLGFGVPCGLLTQSVVHISLT